MLNSRVWIPAVCYLGAAGLLIPGLISDRLTPAVWFDVAGAALLSAANPPLDAARLDIMPAGLWGRAESVRTVIRSLAQALAPILFGLLAAGIAGISTVKQAPIGTKNLGTITPSEARGLEVTFLIMLIALGAAGISLLQARHTYPTGRGDGGCVAPGRRRSVAAGQRARSPLKRTDGWRTSRCSSRTPGTAKK